MSLSIHLRIATQNVQWGGDPAPNGDGYPRLARLMPHLVQLDADILVLTEFKAGERGEQLALLLEAAGYPHLLHRTPSHATSRGYALGTAIAARHPMTAVELPIPSPDAPWRSVSVSFCDIELAGFYFPLGSAKAPYWDWVLSNAAALAARNVALIGDFNTGKHFVDEQGSTFTSPEKIEALEALGFTDAWRSHHPTEREFTWYSDAGNGFRLDYAWLSRSLLPRVLAVRHDHAARTAGVTDHSAVVIDLHLPVL